MRALRAVLVLATVAAVTLGCQSVDDGTGPADRSVRSTAPTGKPTAASTPTGPSTYTTAGIEALLAQVRMVRKRPYVPGYDRECGPGDGCVFGTAWTDDTDAPDSHNGCDTRNDVLREQLQDVEVDPRTHGCKVVAGQLVDPYTGQRMDYATEGSQIQIDHLFPLAAAWDLGASRWTPDQRRHFANDTSIELLAVNGSANESKGDSTPASWLPPLKTYRCEYVTRFLAVAVHYGLAITPADRTVIGFVEKRSCPR